MGVYFKITSKGEENMMRETLDHLIMSFSVLKFYQLLMIV